MLNYIDILKEIKKKNSKSIKVGFFSNFNNIILNNYINYFFKKKTKYQIDFLKTDFNQIDQQLFNQKFINKLKKVEFVILGVDLGCSLDINLNKINLFIQNYKKNINHLIQSLPNKNILIFNITYLESFFQINQRYRFKIQKKIQNFNNYLVNLSNINSFKIVDIYNIVSKRGALNFFNYENLNEYKIPYKDIGHEDIAFEIYSIIYSHFDVKKKCIILDLDNTLWGGILGEKGYKNIYIGENGKGLPFLKFQKYLKLISSEGIILTICSKNNYSDVLECFNNNKNMILKLNDFSIVKCNWDEKYLNVNIIKKQLNIGKNSMVFFDDSKIERDKMLKFNPQIKTINVSDDPNNYIKDIEESGVFKSYSVLEEDKNKKKQYEILKKADILKNKTSNIESFYKKLNMKFEISKVKTKINFDRTYQLIQKTNQFNLTTKRFTEIELKKFIKNKDNTVLIGRLKDVYGDHGYTALAMIKKNNETWTIENFLLSCRILGRKVENEFIKQIILNAKKNKIKIVRGYYKKTKQNIQCKNFYENNMFKKAGKYFIAKTQNYKYKKNIIYSKLI